MLSTVLKGQPLKSVAPTTPPSAHHRPSHTTLSTACPSHAAPAGPVVRWSSSSATDRSSAALAHAATRFCWASWPWKTVNSGGKCCKLGPASAKSTRCLRGGQTWHWQS